MRKNVIVLGCPFISDWFFSYLNDNSIPSFIEYGENRYPKLPNELSKDDMQTLLSDNPKLLTNSENVLEYLDCKTLCCLKWGEG